MIHDLDETLKEPLDVYAGIDLEQVDVKFEMPSPEWSAEILKPRLTLATNGNGLAVWSQPTSNGTRTEIWSRRRW